MDDPMSSVFSMADHLMASLGKCIAGNLQEKENCVPLLVPLALYDKVAIKLESMKAHRLACSVSGRNYHYAQHANLAARQELGEDLFGEYRNLHKHAARERHEFEEMEFPSATQIKK